MARVDLNKVSGSLAFMFVVVTSIQFLFPVLGLLIAILCSFSSKRMWPYFALVSFAALLSLLNAMKVSEGDLTAYLFYYQELKNITSAQFLVRFGAEPVFYVFAFLIGSLTDFSDYWLKYSTSFFGYAMLSIGTYRLFLTAKKERISALILAMFVCMTPFLFSNSLHLIRQFLALAIFIFGISVRDDHQWKVFIFAILTHVSAAILVVFALRINHAAWLRVAALTAFFAIDLIRPIIGSLIGGTDLLTVTYLLDRVTQSEYHDLQGLTFAHQLIVGTGLITTGIWLMTIRGEQIKDALNQVGVVAASLSVIVLVLTLQSEFHEPAARLYFYLLYIFSIMFSLAILQYFRGREAIASVCFSLSAVMVFQLLSGSGTWSYSALPAYHLLTPLLSNAV